MLNEKEIILLESFKKDIKIALTQYSIQELGVIRNKLNFYAFAHGFFADRKHFSFSITKDYPVSIMSLKDMKEYCDSVNIKYIIEE